MKPLHNTHASAKGSYDNIFMNGQEVFKFAVRAVPSVRCLPALLTLLLRLQNHACGRQQKGSSHYGAFQDGMCSRKERLALMEDMALCCERLSALCCDEVAQTFGTDRRWSSKRCKTQICRRMP